MRTFSLLKGMSVYDRSGEVLGEVCDICIGEEGLVTDLLLQIKGFIGKKVRVPVQSVSSFGEDGIILDSNGQYSKYRELDNEHTMHHGRPLAKKNTMTPHGEKLGLLDDVYFLEKEGTIVGYELTDGFFSDITEGKRVIRTLDPPNMGKDAIIVSAINQRGGNAHDEMSELSKQGPW
ncbi:PRC-barrel domain-containing protein [Bacillus norwichensis]|uniref:PRC-barrel domain-containing protein n=1 Tax=Bacillus norwichensis TaxID=2762217 RepID=A0ABR8VFV8_9BACI|nr:PRC-barrel domain-containing protein [Bacillus norwichensis]MBD8003662.1 PRC-barrel domain-containing protein [Bacillus norwichensis]